MTPVVLDSSAWVEFFSDGPKAELVRPYLAAPSESVLVPAVVAYEVYKKALAGFGAETARVAAGRLAQCACIELDRDGAFMAAELSVAHRLAMADAMVLAAAQAYGAELVTLDSDFKGLPRVRLL